MRHWLSVAVTWTAGSAPSGPDEVADVGVAFNFLAERLRLLLAEERESVADLSHRLRTPLTALRLQAETLADREASAVLLDDIDRLESAVDRMIEQARRARRGKRARSSLISGQWSGTGRRSGKCSPMSRIALLTCTPPAGRLPVAMSAQDLGALIDTLLENVFSHTSPGVGYRIEASARTTCDSQVVLVVEDSGTGFEHDGALERGESGEARPGWVSISS